MTPLEVLRAAVHAFENRTGDEYERAHARVVKAASAYVASLDTPNAPPEDVDALARAIIEIDGDDEDEKTLARAYLARGNKLANLEENWKTSCNHVAEALSLLGVDISKDGYVPDTWTLREQCHKAKGQLDARGQRIAELEKGLRVVAEKWPERLSVNQIEALRALLEGT